MRIVFLDDVCIASLSGPTWGMSDSSNQWPDNPQLFTNPHWQCSYNVYCLPVIGMNNIPTQKNNMSWFWFLFVREQNVQLNSSCGIFFSTTLTLIRSFNLATPKVVIMHLLTEFSDLLTATQLIFCATT